MWRKKVQDLSELKNLFAGLEAYFHGKSSGIDPLTSYVNKPLWVSGSDNVRVFKPKDWLVDEPVVFLLDTRVPRQTGPLVHWFLEQAKQKAFKEKLEQELLPSHERVLLAWEQRQADHFWTALDAISRFQLEHMPLMIPDSMHPLWRDTLGSNEIRLKICGAGGGGYILGFARNKAALTDLSKTFSITVPFEKHALVDK